VGRLQLDSSEMVWVLPATGVAEVSTVGVDSVGHSWLPRQPSVLVVLSPLLLSVSESESWQQSQLMFCCVASILTNGPPFRQATTSPVLLK